MNFKQYTFTGEKKFNIKDFNPDDTGEFTKKEELQEVIQKNLASIENYQDKLYAEGKDGLLIIFQAMDAAGKVGASTRRLRAESGGVVVYSFKQPSDEEHMHDYLCERA
jgi:polyphosphate kinase 2 (PPK2 family)